ncbi:MAG: polysaccharide biosynthesis tyrosine autokinase, partial [Bacteroidales bacterium]|nr:polysaccharide biosynthesis tyrosine autokinase [Bacteroidales bacterium]
NKTASFGEIIEINGSIFSIECRDYDWLERNKSSQLCFFIHNRNSLVRHYSNYLKVDMVSRGASMLRISIAGTNPEKDADFINKHLEGFQYVSLDKKNQEADRRIQFIDSQLDWISDTLSTTENRLQQFRSAHRVMDLSTQGQSIVAQVTLLENEKARLNLEANYYDYLADYLTKDSSVEMPIIPITMGINDAGLIRLVEELAILQGQLSSTGAGELNPLQRNLEQKVRSTKDALRETLNGLRRANSLARSEKQEQINRANAQASALPVTERMLVGIERKFRLNDELYTFLLETRAEQQMQKASNKSDNEIIDWADARYSTLVAPDPLKINLIGLLAGVGIPFLILFVAFIFNNRIKEEEIHRITTIPVLGAIPRNELKSNTVVFQESGSNMAEAFRLLRSKMQFFTKEANSPVILVTSPMPGDGKTFVAINLASVYSLLGKKTVLIGFDLRKPKIYSDFKLENTRGLSTWLIGQDKLDDIILKTDFENLFVIPAGPVPPNPSELTALGKTQELFKLLKSRFDFIIVDTSPIGIVSDTYHLASLADVSLLVVRNGKSLRDMFIKTIGEISGSGLKAVSIIMNDVKSSMKHYGYSDKFGYTKNSNRNRKLFRGNVRK